MNKQKRIGQRHTILHTTAFPGLLTFLISAATVFADINTSFDESTLPTNLFLDVPNINVGTITLQTNTQNLLFYGPGTDMWWSRNGLPFAWTPVPGVGIGGSWEAETEVQYYDTSVYGRIVGMTLYSGPDGAGGANYGQEFTFGLDHWDSPNGVWVQGLGDNRPGDSDNLKAALTTDKVTLRMVVSRGVKNNNTYNFYYRLTTNDAWTSVGTIHHAGAFTRAALFFKGNQMNVTFNHFRLTTLDAGTTYAYTTNSDNTLTLTEYAGSETSLVIPDQINGQSVTAIGESAFRNCTSLTNVVIPAGITTINSGAFMYCPALTSITLPNSLTSIGDYAFNNCLSLTNMVIPEGVTTLNRETFAGCTALTSIALPNSLTSIGDSVFNGCTNLTNVMIPESVTSFGNSVFANCTSLSEAPIPGSMTAIGSYMFYGCTGLRTVTIPEGVTSIGDNAFDGCSGLTNIVFPDSLTSLGNYAFNNCSSLPVITIPKNLTSIGYCPFNNCSGMTNVVFPDTMTAIAPGMFVGCTGLGTITIPRGITVIGDGAFSGCYNLTNVVFPDTLTTIGYNAFEGCALTRISIPSSVTAINDYAFYSCTSLTSVTLPGSLTYLPSETFGYCFSLTAVYFQGDAPGMSWDTFDCCWGIVFYYQPETTGWDEATANTGFPAQLWNPTIQAGALGFGPIEGGYYFNISGTPDIPIQVEACTNLTEGCWTPLLTAPLSNGSIDFTDSESTNFPVRFYRIVGP